MKLRNRTISASTPPQPAKKREGKKKKTAQAQTSSDKADSNFLDNFIAENPIGKQAPKQTALDILLADDTPSLSTAKVPTPPVANIPNPDASATSASTYNGSHEGRPDFNDHRRKNIRLARCAKGFRRDLYTKKCLRGVPTHHPKRDANGKIVEPCKKGTHFDYRRGGCKNKTIKDQNRRHLAQHNAKVGRFQKERVLKLIQQQPYNDDERRNPNLLTPLTNDEFAEEREQRKTRRR